MIETVAQGIFDLLFNIINVIVGTIFSPIQYLLPNVFSGILLSEYTSNFYSIINTYIIPTASWFAELVPPMTWNLILIYFGVVLSLYTIVLTFHLVLKPLRIIKKIIPFT